MNAKEDEDHGAGIRRHEAAVQKINQLDALSENEGAGSAASAGE